MVGNKDSFFVLSFDLKGLNIEGEYYGSGTHVKFNLSHIYEREYGDGVEVECAIGLCGNEEDMVLGIEDAIVDLFPLPSDECLELLINMECDYLPRDDCYVFASKTELRQTDIAAKTDVRIWKGQSVRMLFKETLPVTINAIDIWLRMERFVS